MRIASSHFLIVKEKRCFTLEINKKPFRQDFSAYKLADVISATPDYPTSSAPDPPHFPHLPASHRLQTGLQGADRAVFRRKNWIASGVRACAAPGTLSITARISTVSPPNKTFISRQCRVSERTDATVNDRYFMGVVSARPPFSLPANDDLVIESGGRRVTELKPLVVRLINIDFALGRGAARYRGDNRAILLFFWKIAVGGCFPRVFCSETRLWSSATPKTHTSGSEYVE